MTTENYISQNIREILNEINQETTLKSPVLISQTKKDFEGTHTLTLFQIAAEIKMNPEILGNQIGEKLVQNQIIDRYNLVKGFLNMSLSPSFWKNKLLTINSINDFGKSEANSKKVVVEFSSPNTNKPLHLGHLRNIFLGYSVSAILENAGYEVFKVNLVNDRGIHICKSMLAYMKFGSNETPESVGLKGDKLVGNYYVKFDLEYKKEIAQLVADGISQEEAEKKAPLILAAQEMLYAWENNDPEILSLWKKMNAWVYQGFDFTYQSLGVKFDKTYYESDTYLLGKESVQEGLASKVFYQKDDQSVWIDLTEDGLDHKLVLRGDGTSVYITQDMGTADLRYKDYQADHFVYVVGNEQDYHFKVLKLILQKMHKPYSQNLYHLSYGMVELPHGKMKSREGTVVDADELIEEMYLQAKLQTEELGKTVDYTPEQAQILHQTIGLGALKYFILKVDPKKKMMFNPLESIDLQGHTGPFVQYTHARICAIIRKASELNIDNQNIDLIANTSFPIHQTEIDLIYILETFPDLIKDSASKYAPYLVSQYVYDVAKTYNRFYTELSIFNPELEIQSNFRILLSQMTLKVIKKGLGLLGINSPERM